MTETANIVCMKWGTYFGPEYVNVLYRSVAKHINRPFRFICYTDIKEGIDEGVELYDLPEFKSLAKSNGAPYPKQTLFRADLEGFKEGDKFLFMDLDVAVVEDIDCFFDYKPEEDFIIIKDWRKGDRNVGNSSVFRAKVGPLDYVYQYMEENLEAIIKKYGTSSQQYLSAKICEKYGKPTWWPAEWTCSFPLQCMPGKFTRWLKMPKRPAEGTKLLVFHGLVHPKEAIAGIWPRKEPWYKKWYKTIRKTPWVEEYWHE